MNFAPNYFHDLVSLGNHNFVSSYDGVYEIKGNSIFLSNKMNYIKAKTHRLRKINDSLAFYKKDQKPVIVKYKHGQFYPLLDISNMPVKLAGSTESITLIGQDYLIGTEEGFAYYSNKIKDGKIFPPKINSVCLLEHPDSNVLGLEPIIFTANQNNLSFHYCLPDFGSVSEQVFETVLQQKGQVAIVSSTTAPFKEYTNLSFGKYIFYVRIRRNGKVYQSTPLNFEIKVPWYLTTFAFLLYCLLFIILGVIIFKIFKWRLNKIKHKLEVEKAAEIREINILREKEALEQTLARKQEELAFISINYVQKKISLSKVSDKIIDLLSASTFAPEKGLIKVKTLMNEFIKEENQDNWHDFEMHYDKANDNFFAKLKAFDPDIDESNLLLCSYILLNKNNQEIADLMFLAKESIAKRKYRLKKKWNLDDKTDLRLFLKAL